MKNKMSLKLLKFYLFHVINLILLTEIKAEEVHFSMNGKRSINTVSDKFLSLSVDPSILQTGLNLSDNSLYLAQHLSPAFIRMAGPSTSRLLYKDSDSSSSKKDNVIITPDMWFGINEWLTLTNLTPIFGINDVETSKGVWNPRSALPLLELSDKLNISCYWQLGFDCSNKSEEQYKQDVHIFRHVLDKFPNKNESWKIIGADLSKCDFNLRSTVVDLEDIAEAVMWEPNSFLENTKGDAASRFLAAPGANRNFLPFWTSIPKIPNPFSFAAALKWATQLGEAAKLGYKVLLAQPSLQEMNYPSPAYWFSILYKNLMGKTVLDVKEGATLNSRKIFAHCTKNQNSFARRGAVTILIINDNPTEELTAVLRLGVSSAKPLEIQSYILTNPEKNEIYLNEQKLTMKLLKQDKVTFTPKIRRAKPNKLLSFVLPPKSIGFFVLPGARIPACIHEELELDALIEEIYGDDEISSEEDIKVEVVGRGAFRTPTFKLTTKDTKNLAKTTISEPVVKKSFPKTDLRSRLEEGNKKKMQFDARNYFIERAKFIEKKHDKFPKRRKEIELPKASEEVITYNEPVVTLNNPIVKSSQSSHGKFDINLSSAEVTQVLRNRAKSKAAQKNIIFTSEELDDIIGKATRRFGHRRQRDINMKLLELKTRANHEKPHHEPPTFHQKSDFQSEKTTHKEKSSHHSVVRSPPVIVQPGYGQQTGPQQRPTLQQWWQQWQQQYNSYTPFYYRRKRDLSDLHLDPLKIKADLLSKKLKFDKVSTTSSTTKKPIRKFENNEEKQATIRDPTQTSEELLKELEEYDDEAIIDDEPKEIFAELAGEDKDESHESFEKFKAKLPKSLKKKNKKGKPEEKSLEDDIQILTESDEFEELEAEDFPYSLHEFTHSEKDNKTDKLPKLEFWEMQIKKLDKKKKEKPSSKKSKEESDEFKDLDDDLEEIKDIDKHELFKREISLITKQDIDNYKKVVQDNLQEIKNNWSNLRSKVTGQENNIYDKIKGLNYGESVGLPSEYWDKYKNKKKEIVKNIEELQDKLGVKKGAQQLLQRSSKTFENLKKELNLPKLKLFKRSVPDKFPLKFGNYKSLSKQLEAPYKWKPTDLRSLVKNAHIKDPKLKQFLLENNLIKKSKNFKNRRAIRDDLSENDIDYSYLNEINKDSKFLHPEVDDEDNDLKIIFPNKDQFEIKNNLEDTDVIYRHFKDNEDKIVETTVKIIEETTKSFVDSKESSKSLITDKDKRSNQSSSRDNIQKIPSRKDQEMMNSFFKQITKIFTDIGQKVKGIFNFILH